MGKAQMTERTLFEIPQNPSVKEKDGLRLSKQAWQIYNLLQIGPVTTWKIVSIACQYNARINEIRHALKPLDLMVDEIKGHNGGSIYKIVVLSESTFWQKVKDKGEALKW